MRAVDRPFEDGSLVAVVGSHKPLLTVVVVDSDQVVVEIEFGVGTLDNHLTALCSSA